MRHHPVAALFPLLGEEELTALADDIRQNGLRNPIVTLDGQILDGRNRSAACLLAGVKPDYTPFKGDELAAIKFVVSENLHRRHLTQSQKAAIAAESLPKFEAEARERMLATQNNNAAKAAKAEVPYLESTGQARDKAAATVGVTPRLVSDAKAVLKADPELFEAVKRGEKSVGEARREVAAILDQERSVGLSSTVKVPKAPGMAALRKQDLNRAFSALSKLEKAIDDLRLTRKCSEYIRSIRGVLDRA